MSMPGFVFHIRCPECHKASPDYPLYIFPNLFSADILLPAWSRAFRCFSEVICFLTPEDRTDLENNRDRLRDFAARLSSPGFTVGFPIWSFEADQIRVKVEPAPDCPQCGCRAEVRPGYPPDAPVQRPLEVRDPYAVPIPMLGLSVRARNALQTAGIESLGQLCERTPAQLAAIPHLSETTLEEIQNAVITAGLKLRDG